MSDISRKFEELMDDAERQGWRRRDTEGGHYQLFAPDGKAIVVAPGTPSDHRAYANFLADLKRNGYKPADERKQLLEQRRVTGVRRAVIDVLKRKAPQVLHIDDVAAIVHSVVPNSNDHAVSATLAILHNQGLAVRVGKGAYRWSEEPTPTPAPAPLPAQDVGAAIEGEAEEDERELDEALVALSRIEAVVLKHKGIARQLRELKRVLGVK